MMILSSLMEGERGSGGENGDGNRVAAGEEEEKTRKRKKKKSNFFNSPEPRDRAKSAGVRAPLRHTQVGRVPRSQAHAVGLGPEGHRGLADADSRRGWRGGGRRGFSIFAVDARRRERARCRGRQLCAQRGGQGRGQPSVVLESHDEVGLGEARGELDAVALREAAGDDDLGRA